jgi:ABC-type amino acid transport substrate-binding protein
MDYSIKNEKTIQDLRSGKIQGVLVDSEFLGSMILFLMENGFGQFKITKQNIRNKEIIDVEVLS